MAKNKKNKNKKLSSQHLKQHEDTKEIGKTTNTRDSASRTVKDDSIKPKEEDSSRATKPILPLSMQIMKPFWEYCYCPDPNCSLPNKSTALSQQRNHHPDFRWNQDHRPFYGTSEEMPELLSAPTHAIKSNTLTTTQPSEDNNNTKISTLKEKEYAQNTGQDNIINHDKKPLLNNGNGYYSSSESLNTTLSPTIPNHITPSQYKEIAIIQTLLQDYITAANFYGCRSINAGVLTTLRFSLPTLRVSGSFHDSDMLALSEILFQYGNTALKFIRRLDFSVASREGKLHGKKGLRSHGAYTLSKILMNSRYIEEVYLQRNKVGPYGASALFLAASKNPILKTLVMRKCCVGEKGAFAFVEHVVQSKTCGLKEVDLSVNGIGFRGCLAIEEAMLQREVDDRPVEIDIEGNLVIQEVMNGVTHGLGIILCVIGAVLLSNKVKNSSTNDFISCGVYSLSLLVLYTSSTLYHSFFALTVTRYVFAVLDHCAIYILIAGSYTPFLRISLGDSTKAMYMLFMIWSCGICGVLVEAFHSNWVYKPKFTLAMYIGMGWSAMVVFPDMMQVMPIEALQLVVLGGIAYTAGVPFFVRNNNLDHSIWHCFVLAGSILHWLCVYIYVVQFDYHPNGSILDGL